MDVEYVWVGLYTHHVREYFTMDPCILSCSTPTWANIMSNETGLSVPRWTEKLEIRYNVEDYPYAPRKLIEMRDLDFESRQFCIADAPRPQMASFAAFPAG